MNAVTFETAGWLIVHSTWQFLLAGLVCWAVADLLCQHRSPSLRYAIFLTGMLAMIACPVATFVWLGDRLPAGPAMSRAAFVEAQNLSPAQYGGAIDSDFTVQSQTADVETTRPTTASLGKQPLRAQTKLISALAIHIQPWLPSIVVFWCAGVFALATRLSLGWWRVERIKRGGKVPNDSALIEAFDRAVRNLGLRRRVRLLISELIDSPVVVGAFESVVLVPANFFSSITPQHMEAILAHELAHVRRYDYLVNLFQSIVETIFFYHPAVWFISRRMRTLREHSCDDIAAAAMNSSVVYGRALVAIEELRSRSPSLAIGARDGDLASRVRRLVRRSETVDTVVPSGPIVVTIIASLSLMASLGVLTLRADDLADEKQTPDAFVANISDQLSVELLAVRPHGKPLSQAWKPNGSNPDQTIEFSHSNDPDGFEIDEPKAYDLLFRYQGLSDGMHPTYHVDGARADTWRNPFPDGEAFLIVTEKEPSASANLTVGIPDANWGPWRQVDKQGNVINPQKMEPRHEEAYRTMLPQDLKARGTRSMLRWAQDKSDEKLAKFEIVAIGDDGERHKIWGRTNWIDSEDVDRSAEIFDLPIEKISRVEYRLRPIRHWVTFKDVSLRSGQRTRVSVSVRSVPIPEPVDDSAAIQRPQPDAVAQRLGEQIHWRLAAFGELPAFLISTKSVTSYYGMTDGMIGLKDERSLAHLKETLAIRKFDETLSDMSATWAWRDNEVVATDRNVYLHDGESFDQASTRTWNGQRGWYQDSVDQFGRYRSFSETFRNHYFRPTTYFHLGNHRFAWADVDDYPHSFVSSTIPVEQADFQSLPDEDFADELCRVIRSIPRKEQFWIGKQSGRLLGCLTFISQGRFVPLHEVPSLPAIAGQTFETQQAARQWLDNDATDQQKRQVSADWAYLHRDNQFPGRLTEFSDYREIVPGLELPHTEWRSSSLHEGVRFAYHVERTEVVTTNMDPDISELVAATLPKVGDTINDWRFGTHVLYEFDPEMPESEIHAKVDEKSTALRENQAAVERLMKPLREMVGRDAPELAGEPLPGKILPKISREGKTLLHFWAVWCGPCKIDVPILNKLSENGLNVIGVHSPGTEAAEVQATASDLEMNYPVMIGDEANGTGLQPDRISGFPVPMFPCSVLIDDGGTVLAVGSLSDVLQRK